MSNINLCAVNRSTGFCPRCQMYMELPPTDPEFVCNDLQDEFLKYDPDTGEYDLDG